MYVTGIHTQIQTKLKLHRFFNTQIYSHPHSLASGQAQWVTAVEIPRRLSHGNMAANSKSVSFFVIIYVSGAPHISPTTDSLLCLRLSLSVFFMISPSLHSLSLSLFSPSSDFSVCLNQLVLVCCPVKPTDGCYLQQCFAVIGAFFSWQTDTLLWCGTHLPKS